MSSIYPYVDAVMLENNQAEMIRKIQKLNILNDLKIIPMSDLQSYR